VYGTAILWPLPTRRRQPVANIDREGTKPLPQGYALKAFKLQCPICECVRKRGFIASGGTVGQRLNLEEVSRISNISLV